MRDSCRNATPTELGYGDPRGTEALRRVLAGVPSASPGHRRRRRADRDLRRVRPGDQPRAALARRRRRAAGGDRRPRRRRLLRDLLAPRNRGGSDPDRRARDRRRRPRRDRRPRGDPHPHPPVPDGHRARPRAPPGAGRLGRRPGRHDHRGRLRRGVPLRPRPGRSAAGARPRSRRADRHRQQVARAGAPARLGRVPRCGCSRR